MAFQGYYLKIGGCNFQSPAIKREGYNVNSKIVQVTDEKVLASGKLSIKELEHKPTKISITFPVMTWAQMRYYKQAFRGELSAQDEMYLTVEYYDLETDTYLTGTFYHTDLVYTPVIYNGQHMVLVDTVKLIEH